MRFGLFAPLVAACVVAVPCRAAIFVSDVEATGAAPSFTLHYLLNEAAVSGSIAVAAASAPDTALTTIPLAGDNLKQGPHDVAFDASSLAAGDYVFKVSVTAAPHAGYDVIVPVTDIPDAQTVSYGLKVNRVPGSPGYGHIYTADYTAHVVQEMTAAGGFIQNNPVAATGDFTPVGLTFDANGDFYITDQNIDHIYQFHATGSTTMPTWAQVADFTGVLEDPETNDGSFGGRGFQLFGTGKDAVAYIAAYNPVPNPVLKATLGDTANPPETLFTGGSIAGTRVDQVLVSADEKTIYIASGAVGTTNLNKYIYGTDPNTLETGWYLDPDFVQNTADNATLNQRSRGLIFSPDGKFLWVTQSKASSGTDVNYVAKVATEPLPTDAGTTSKILRIAGGLEEGPIDTYYLYDLNLDNIIDIQDAAIAITKPGPAGSVVARIPMPTLEGGAGPVLPFSLDRDPKGNLVVGVNKNNAGSAIVGTSFLVIAPPDDGSSDSATSAKFTR